MSLFTQFWNDSNGFIVSAELVLIATILVLGVVVGMAEIASGINQELEDVGAAFGRVNQSYRISGFSGTKAEKLGSIFVDGPDECDSEHDIVCDSPIYPESQSHHGHYSHNY